MLPGLIDVAKPNFDSSDSVVVMKLLSDDTISKNDIWVDAPIGFSWSVSENNGNIYVLIMLDPFFLDPKRN